MKMEDVMKTSASATLVTGAMLDKLLRAPASEGQGRASPITQGERTVSLG